MRGCRTRVWHGLTQGAASDAAVCTSVSCLSFFFFFFTDLRQLGSIHADLASIRAKPSRFSQNLAISAELGCIGQQPKQPKHTEISLKPSLFLTPKPFPFCPSQPSEPEPIVYNYFTFQNKKWVGPKTKSIFEFCPYPIQC